MNAPSTLAPDGRWDVQFMMGDLNFRVNFAHRVCCHFPVNSADQRVAIFRTQLFNNIGQVGRMHLLK